MKKPIKVIALDIDGTITDENRFLCLEAVRELRKIISNGIKLILCTGNIACFARSTAILIGTDAPVIAENGGVIEFKDGKEIVLTEKRESENAFNVLKKEFEVTRFYEDRETEVVLKNDVDLGEIRAFLEEFDIDIIDTGFAIHLKPKKTDKSIALKKVLDNLDISMKEVLSIGDSVNDVELIKKTGIGVAVKNSPFVLKREADYVTDKKFGNGVIEALNKFLNNKKRRK